MGSEILKGCTGACRIIIVVFLLATSIIFGVNLKYQFIEDHMLWYPLTAVSLSFVFMVVQCIWYSLLFYDVVEYSEDKRKSDGTGHYISGIILILIIVGLMLSWYGIHVLAAGLVGGSRDEMEEQRRVRNSYFIISGSISFTVSAVVGIVLGCKLRCCSGGGAEQAPAQASDVNDNSIPTPDPASQSKL